MLVSLILTAADLTAVSDPPPSIVITASRVPQKRDKTAASVTVIDDKAITRQGAPLLTDFLRDVPSAAVSSSGPDGTVTEVRIRGAEADHTLLFIDGIEANDLSSSDDPRFELLNSDLASRIEVVRGPQSALWGSQAIGGVISVTAPVDASGYSASAEGGSYGFQRASTSASLVSGDLQLAGALGWQRATGIDKSGTGGDKDGYHNLSGRALASWTVAPDVTVGVNGFSLNGYSQFDGTNPFTFLPTQDLSTRFGMSAARIWSTFGSTDLGWGGSLSASLFGSHSNNLFETEGLNQTDGLRRTLSGQVQYGFQTGGVKQQLIAAADYQNETFRSRDTVYGGLSDQDQRRIHQSITGEWKGDAGFLVGDVAVRHDAFDEFKDATTLRASLLSRLGGGFALTGSYGEGISPRPSPNSTASFQALTSETPILSPRRRADTRSR